MYENMCAWQSKNALFVYYNTKCLFLWERECVKDCSFFPGVDAPFLLCAYQSLTVHPFLVKYRLGTVVFSHLSL